MIEIKLKSFYAELTPDYLEDRKQELDDITNLIDSNDFEKIKDKFHQISGSAGSYGLNIISDIASNIEDLSIGKDADKIKQSYLLYKESLTSIKLIFE